MLEGSSTHLEMIFRKAFWKNKDLPLEFNKGVLLPAPAYSN